MEFDTCNGAGASIQTGTILSGTYAGKILNPASGVRTGWALRFAVSNPGSGGVYARFYFRIVTLPNVLTTIVVFHDTITMATDAAPEIGLQLDTNGTLVLSYAGSTIYGSPSSALNLNQWYRIEIFEDGSFATGACLATARVDGVDFASTTTGSFGGNFVVIRLGGNLLGETCTTGQWFIDDVGVNSTSGSAQNSWPGAGSIVHCHPDSAGDFTEGLIAGSSPAATGFGSVNEVTPDDAVTQFNLQVDSANATSADRLDVNCGAMPSATSVTLVQVGIRIKPLSNAVCSYVLRIKSQASGTIVESTPAVSVTGTAWATHDDTASSRQYKLTSYTDPQAGGSWTQALVNSMQIGARAPDATPDVMITKLWALVEYIPLVSTSTVSDASSSLIAGGVAFSGGGGLVF